MSMHMSMHIHMSIHMPIHMSIHVSMQMPIRMAIHMSIHMSGANEATDSRSSASLFLRPCSLDLLHKLEPTLTVQRLRSPGTSSGESGRRPATQRCEWDCIAQSHSLGGAVTADAVDCGITRAMASWRPSIGTRGRAAMELKENSHASLKATTDELVH